MKNFIIAKICLVLISLTSNACGMTNKRDGSKISSSKTANFHDYNNVKSLEEYLNKTYPIGSDVDRMVNDMKKMRE